MNNQIPEEPIAWINGNWAPLSKASVPIFDLGLWGLAATEMMRTWSGHVVFAERHIDRLYNTIDAIGIDQSLAHVFEKSEFSNLIEAVVERNRSLRANGELGLSVSVSAGVNSSLIPNETQHTGTTSIVPFRVDPQRLQQRIAEGQRLRTSAVQQIPSNSIPPELKNRSRLHWKLAELDVQKADPNAIPVLLNADGSIAETNTANIFVVKNGKLRSPATNVLPGITAGVAIEVAENIGVSFSTSALFPNDIRDADEAFTTSSIVGICPVVSFNGKKIGTQFPGPITQQLTAAFAARVKTGNS